MLLTMTTLSFSKQKTNCAFSVSRKDPHSFARPWEAYVKHVFLDLKVDFEKKEIEGVATLKIEQLTDTSSIVLDTQGLAIESVRLNKDKNEASYDLGKEDQILGAPLTIKIKPTTKSITIHYRTTGASRALQWFEPSQTVSKRQPFILTQSESIHARSWIPLQDSPQVRVTYDASVSVKNNKSVQVVMSAKRLTSTKKTARFKMKHPIAPYLIALAVGDIKFAPISKRAGIWADPKVLKEAASDFKDTEKALLATERIFGKYDWDRADLLVNPMGFPYGGMENPGMIFLTPTLLTGDASLFDVVIHELAHSWSGNKVTNATWADFWLNESFTDYTEWRILEALYGRDYAEMKAKLLVLDLEEEFEELLKDSPKDTHLRVDFSGRDPDDIPGATAYVKGYLFLRMLENTFGREKFDEFLNAWFEEHKFQSVTTDDFVSFLKERLVSSASIGAKKMEKKLMISAWVDGPGVPENAPVIESKHIDHAEKEAKRFSEENISANDLKTDGWNATQFIYFLKKLKQPLGLDKMKDLDKRYNFTKSTNSEILFAWLVHVITSDYQPAMKSLEKFLLSVGRNKFVKPLYKELAKTEKGKAFGLRVYKKAKASYYAMVQRNVEKELGLDK